MTDELLEEVNRMIKDGKLDSGEAQLLLLAQVAKTNRRLIVLETQQGTIIRHLETIETAQTQAIELSERVGSLEELHKHYPSLVWLAVNRTKMFTLGLALFIVLILVIGTPWNISDIRHVVLNLLGLDPTLGVGS